MRPGDVLTMRNGKTVEVLNTDAEGRLILADALSLASEEGADAIIDLATLTGAVTIALGDKIAGLMGSDDAWVDAGAARPPNARASACGSCPLPEDYRRNLDSEIADLRNISTGGGGGHADRRALPEGVRGRRAVGAPRHRGHRARRRATTRRRRRAAPATACARSSSSRRRSASRGEMTRAVVVVVLAVCALVGCRRVRVVEAEGHAASAADRSARARRRSRSTPS